MKELNFDVKAFDGNPTLFQSWHKKIILKLTAAGQAHLLVDQKTRKETDINPGDAADLIQATAAIMLTLEGKPARDTENCLTPFAILSKLSSTYNKINKMSMFRHLTELTTLRLKENEDVAEYLTKFEDKANELRQCGFDKDIKPEELFKLYLLASLPQSYESLIGGLVNDLELETYEEVYTKILNKSVFSLFYLWRN